MNCLKLLFLLCLMMSHYSLSHQKPLTSSVMKHALFHRSDFPFSDLTFDTKAKAIFNPNCTDSKSCLQRCQHGKVWALQSGCCSCTCRQGYILSTNGKSCTRARFGDWSTWSSCIVSEWGGVQHRGRLCKTKLGRSANNRCVGAGSQSRSCSKVTRDFRIRKNLLDLTHEELHDFIQGFTKFKQDHSLFGYLNTAKWHGWPNRCPWYKHGIEEHKDGHCSWHNHPMFLSWHRLIMVQLELGLSRHMKNKTLGIPYWDWTDPTYKGIPDLVKNPTIYDPILKEYVHNPFYRTYIPSHALVNNQTLYNYRSVERAGFLRHNLMLKNIIQAVNMPSYEFFDMTEVGAHGQVHNCMCVSKGGNCTYSMLKTAYSCFDSTFFLHHSQIDRVYALYQKLRHVLGTQDWTKESFLGPYKREHFFDFFNRPDVSGSWDWPMSPFCNASMNPSYVTLNENSWTVANSYYYQELFGYKYDTFDFARRDWKLLLKDLKQSYESKYYGKVVPYFSHLGKDLGEISHQSILFNGGCTV
ncbi:hemocyanin, beta-C chain unit D-like [Ciona intestinalis]